ncbi:unnamed protein product [Spirodela intermedia]|uniref:Uncharacterized protein n=1 Tax=Spirodela intermedia TaxID=51605 RepID=A0A7I8IFV0_SPIIN|nr:unnamed protein product [Spirodela intermedia]CAA6656749.1 unnamed protein product [Spirodela intermedia]
MGRRPAGALAAPMPSPKRPQRAPALGRRRQATERKAYDAIWRKGDMGMWTADLKAEMGLAGNMPTKIINALKGKGLIKDVVNYRNRGARWSWLPSLSPIMKSRAAPGTTARAAWPLWSRLRVPSGIRGPSRWTVACSRSERSWAPWFWTEVLEVTSTGKGEFVGLPPGKKCYRCPREGGGGPKMGAFGSIPCGVCPRIAECTPDGVISPKNCVYYDKWLSSLEF